MCRLFVSTLILVLCVFQPLRAVLACVNTPDPPLKVGKSIDLDTLGPQDYVFRLFRDRPSTGDWESALVDPETARKRGLAPLSANSRAVVLIHLGRTEEALEILKRIERSRPGSYYVAANIGTAYELLGDNVNAYKWIEKGMELNPDSHFGTEWLHLQILKAKQAIEKAPKWIETNSVLGIDWESIGSDLSRVQVKHERTVYDADAVRRAIEYQLHERTEFVQPTDPTVASLLYDLSLLVRHSRSQEHGDHVLAAAYKYGYPQTSTSVPTVASPAVEVPRAVAQTSYWIPAGIVAGILALIGLASFWVLMRRSKRIK